MKERALAATAAALAASCGVLCAGVPLLPLRAVGALVVAAALGWRVSPTAGLGACIAFVAAVAQHAGADWKTVVGVALGMLAISRWYAAAIVAATLIFFFA